MAQADFTRISTNIAALNTLNSLRNINSRLGTAQLRLATGKRINQAADDPAGLTIALKMNARNEGLKAALGNIGDAKNMLAVAESGLGQVSEILTEMKAKATAAASDTLGDDERNAIKSQLQSLARQINDIVSETTWNGLSLLGGEVTKSLQTGAGDGDTTMWNLQQDHTATAAGGLNLGTAEEDITLTDVNVDTSFNNVARSSSTWLTELATGTYEFEVTLAGNGTVGDGEIDASRGNYVRAGTMAASAGAPTAELANGAYRLHVDSINTGVGDISYTVYNVDTGSAVVTRATSVDCSGAAADLLDNGGGTIGVSLAGSTLQAGDDIYFDYAQANDVQVQLSRLDAEGNGTAVSVDIDGDPAAADTRLAFFKDLTAAGTFDTGRGITLDMKIIGSMVEGHKYRFDLTAAGDVTVNLDSATAANAFLSTVDTAISTVSDSINSVGSLSARLDAKEQAVGVAQVNTEAAYNRIMNADMAFEQVEASKYMILQQTALAMLAQANMAPQGILSLFR